MSNFGFIKVAAIVPPIKVADPDYNAGQIIGFAKKAASAGAKIIVSPELGITGYTAADLFNQRTLLDKTLSALAKLKTASRGIKSVIIVGAPLEAEGKLFNTAVVILQGKILGIVPKTFIPGYKEFYEERWFASARDLISKEISLLGALVPIGTDLLFRFKNLPETILGIEICEDLWVPIPPSSHQALAGANIIANLSGSNELVGKADYRRELVSQQSARSMAAYIYAGAGVHESTTDLVFGGHAMISENGHMLSESKRFIRDGEIITADIDIEHLLSDRARTTSFGEAANETGKKFRFIDVPLEIGGLKRFERKIL